MKRLTTWLRLALVIAACGTSAVGHESPIDHVDRSVQIYIESGKLHVTYQFSCEERQAMLQLYQMDTNRDGKISDEEREAYFSDFARRLAAQLHIEVDGHAISLASEGSVRLAPDLSQTYTLTAPIEALSVGNHTGRFTDDFSRNHPGPYRWTPRQTNPNGIAVDAVAAPGAVENGSHQAMIAIDLKIVVQPPKASK